MQTVTFEQLLAAIQAVGVNTGDGLLVHSALQYFGRPVGGVGIYYQVLCQALGINAAQGPDSLQGTLAVPAFNFAFARGEPYDPRTTPSASIANSLSQTSSRGSRESHNSLLTCAATRSTMFST